MAQQVIKDRMNEKYMFQTTDVCLLVKILKKNIDLKSLVIAELNNRGLDKNGNWVGFNK